MVKAVIEGEKKGNVHLAVLFHYAEGTQCNGTNVGC